MNLTDLWTARARRSCKRVKGAVNAERDGCCARATHWGGGGVVGFSQCNLIETLDMGESLIAHAAGDGELHICEKGGESA